MAAKAVMSVLEDISSCSSSGSDSDAEAAAKEAAAKKQKKEITLEDLQRAGLKSGPSIMAVKPPKAEENQSWDWSDGRKAKAVEGAETLEDRRATQHAATTAVETSAQYTKAALEHAQRLRDEQRIERERLAEAKRLSFNQKEKRKRDEGKASRGKNFVEEEKRLGRALGQYSGFD